ncbi:MraY family glycosyltransferase [Flavobacteriaceae bacterium KMM 6897]|nr:MraY family glycosyltransferase [Flavobacteriaceae bacterium KMM 6897]
MTDIIELQYYPHFLVFFAILMPLLLSFRMFPVIIYLVHSKNLMDEPVDRSMHTLKTPTLGGLGIFIAFSLPIIVLVLGSNFSQLDLIKLLSLISAGILLVFAGIKDDLVGLAPKKKMMVQAVAAVIVILMTDVRIRSLDGLFGMGELPFIVSICLTLFAFLFLINAVNLIDGIDGLAGTFGIVTSLSFGMYFIINAHYLMVLVSFVLIGGLLGFLRYNFSKERKIFMGDSGSMFLGFLLAYQAVCFLNINILPETTFKVANAPILFLAILSFPILDTIRVFCIRIAQKRSPFSADRKHIHHRLLDLGYTHIKGTALIALAQLLIIGLAFTMGDLDLTLQFILLMAVVPMVFLSPWLLVLKKDIPMKLEEKIDWNSLKVIDTLVEKIELHTEQQFTNMLAENNIKGYMEVVEKEQSIEQRISFLEKLMAKRFAAIEKFKKWE